MNEKSEDFSPEEKKKLEAFQYRPFIKRVHILLPNYSYLHSTSKENARSNVGRKKTEEQFLNFLKKGGTKGSYLITGYRGMGKTTLVNKVVDGYINNGKKEKVSISFGQKNITELDILRQIVHEIKNKFDSRYRCLLLYHNLLISTFPIFLGVATFMTLLLTSVLVWDSKEFKKIIENNEGGIDLLTLAVFLVLISVIFSIFATFVLKLFMLPFKKVIRLHQRIDHLLDRSTSQFTSEESAGTGSENFPILLSRKKSKAYAIAGAKEISNEIISILGNVSKELKIAFVFIFDELDKIDTSIQQTLNYEDTQLLDGKGETFSFDDHRRRKKLILDILSSLKYLITEANAKFIFIAGSEMFDAALADVSDRHSAISSIFGHILNVDSLYKDKADTDSIGTGITNLIEHFLLKIIDPDNHLDKNDSILKIDWCWNGEAILFEDKLKVIYVVQHFINFLAYRSTGSPKKLIKIIEEHTRPISCTYDDKNKFSIPRSDYKDIYVTCHGKYPNKFGSDSNNVFLSFSYYDQYKFGLLNYFYRPIIISKSRVMKNYSDSLLVSIPYLMDHIHKFNGNAFSMENLELLPEVLSSGRNPELRTFLEELIEQFKQNLIRGTETKFFDYKFNYKIYSEIVHVSTLFAEESSAYNFTLDENYNIKLYLRLKIRELRNIYKDFGGKEGGTALDSIALYNSLLGDVTYFDREYSDAIGCYLDALGAMQNDDLEKNKSLALGDFHAFAYLKCMMKLALCYEKIKSYEKAITCYIDVINVIGKITAVEAKYFLHEEMTRYKINALFSCLFIYEKQPSLGGFRRLFEHVMNLKEDEEKSQYNKEKSKYWKKIEKYGNIPPLSHEPVETDGLKSIRFRDFLMKEDSFLHHLSILLFYRNSPRGDKKVVEDILKYRRRTDSNRDGHAGSSAEDQGVSNNLLPEYLPIKCIISLLLNKFGKSKLKYIFSELEIGYKNKTLSPEIAFFVARNLSRLGNLYYSSYNQIINGDGERKSSRNKKHDIEDLITSVIGIRFAVKPSDGERSLKSITPEEMNASDMIKEWLWNWGFPDFNDRNNFLDSASLKDIMYIYIFSAKMYMYSSHSLMGVHQYRKIMAILRAFALDIKALDKESQIKPFLEILKKTIIRRSLQIASWNSSSTDRNQIYKYKHALGINHIHHDESVAKHNYKNVSNAPDVKEAIWHFVTLSEVCNSHDVASIPMDTIDKNPNQSFINQTAGIHTMYARLNELDVQCSINKSMLLRICSEESLDINKAYQKLRKSDDYEVEPLNEVVPNINGLKQIDQLPYLIANWIFCLHNIIQIIQTKGHSYLFTFSTLADQYRRLGDVLKYYEVCRFLFVKGKLQTDVFELTADMIGKDAIRSMDTTSLYQMATRNYRAAISTHTRGSQYRYMISNMYFLEDDFHDNVFHFSMSFERQRINSGEIMDKLRELNKELSTSQVFDYDTHINNVNEWMDLTEKIKYE